MLDNLENTYTSDGITIESNYGLRWDYKDINDDFICICENTSDNCIGITLEQAEFVVETLNKIIREFKNK